MLRTQLTGNLSFVAVALIFHRCLLFNPRIFYSVHLHCTSSEDITEYFCSIIYLMPTGYISFLPPLPSKIPRE